MASASVLSESRSHSDGFTSAYCGSYSTIVMANLGYFQFKANPGPWQLGIRPGRSSDIYAIESVGAQGISSEEVDKTGTSLFVSTFEGLTLYPRFKRKPGQEMTDLLDEKDAGRPAQGGLFNRLKAQ